MTVTRKSDVADDPNPMQVCRDVLSNGYVVSTISLGNFETMVFVCRPDGKPEHWKEQDFRRYSSREDAVSGHEEIVQKWMAKT